MDEATLIKACLDNDRQSQKLLYERYSGQMYAICLRYMHNEFDAADALQRTFIKVFRHLHTFSATGPLGAWIRRITITTCVEDLRSQKQRSEKMGDYIHMQPLAIHHDEENLTYEQLLGLLDLLPKGYRSVFNMFVLDDMKHSEIGEILGITEETSRSQLLKARKFLQKLIVEKRMII